MNYALIIAVCSYINGQLICGEPLTDTRAYENWYTCTRQGYLESVAILDSIGSYETNRDKLGVKIMCSENANHR